jgi:hypothetical protein
LLKSRCEVKSHGRPRRAAPTITPEGIARPRKTTVGAALRGRPWDLTLLFLLLSFVPAAAQTNRSIYTPISDKQCRTIKSAEAGDDGYEARCRGTAGYTLLLSEGDLRQNITVITPQGKRHSLDLWSVVSGGFSSVGPKAEWRIATQNQKSAPVALILRYNASENPEAPDKRTSYLAVAKITSTEICVVEKISPGPTANEDARRSADAASTKSCLKNP